MTLRIAPAPVRAEPTSLLSLVAGEFAPRIGRVWPAPHTAFLTAPSARRHLVCLALAFGGDLAALGETLLKARMKRAIPAAAPSAPPGLERALTRMGDVAWTAEDYRKLLALLADPPAAKVLRHAELVDLALVRRMADLPAAMAPAALLAARLPGETVAALRETYAALRMRSGPAAADAAAARWARATSVRALVEAVRDDLYPEPAAPPHPGTARLRPLASKQAIRQAARRFRNCLADTLPHAASGWSAYYEWTGPPDVVIEVTRDAIFGWRMEQARVADNAPVPEAVRSEIVSELALIGVHVGRSCWELDRALAVADQPPFPLRPAEAVAAEAFGDF